MDTLLVSSSYEPLYRVCWQDAMTLWASGRVEVVANHVERCVRTVAQKIPLPSILRFRRSGGHSYRPGVRFSKDNVYARDRGECQYCGVSVSRTQATFDHVVPRRLGGKLTWDNAVVACRGCNQRKGGRTPEQARMRLRNIPVKPRTVGAAREILDFDDSMPESWRPFLSRRKR